MHSFFRRQLALYASYHRDARNCVTHMIGIPVIFLAVTLPLSLLPVTVSGFRVNAALVLLIPALMVWLLLDVAIGSVILAAALALLAIAACIAAMVGSVAVWSIAAALFAAGWTLQIVGHAHFEHRKPALLDNPVHMLIGPMFMVAKLLVALGLRSDLTDAIRSAAEPAAAVPVSPPNRAVHSP
ncbi:MAG TPA: Mpo1-like protein [Pseudolabrys sp.]|nr:Mpo1-like protein [Pseudolabrys sp.]